VIMPRLSDEIAGAESWCSDSACVAVLLARARAELGDRAYINQVVGDELLTWAKRNELTTYCCAVKYQGLASLDMAKMQRSLGHGLGILGTGITIESAFRAEFDAGPAQARSAAAMYSRGALRSVVVLAGSWAGTALGSAVGSFVGPKGFIAGYFAGGVAGGQLADDGMTRFFNWAGWP
jgi:hypothetical protein